MIKASAQEDDNYLYSCNNLLEGKKKFPLSKENMQQVKDKSIDAERAARIFGERPSWEEIQKMWANRYKGLTYQIREGNPPQGYQQGPVKFHKKYTQPVGPSVKGPQWDSSTCSPFELKLNVTNWMSNAKMSAPMIELAKIPYVGS